MVLDFADEVNVGPMLWTLIAEEFPQISEIFQRAGERYSNVVNFVLEPKLDYVILVIFGNSGQIDDNPGEAHILFVAQLAIILYLHCHSVPPDLLHYR